jgi:hypothetical protein
MASGILRSALKAGQWAKAAAESRRQSRILRELSSNLNWSGVPRTADEFIESSRAARGLPSGLTERDIADSFRVFAGGSRPRANAFLGESPFGGNVYGTGMGRQRFAGAGLDFNMMGGYNGTYGSAFDNGFRSPIASPYESFATYTTPSQRAGMLDDLTAAGLPEDPMLYSSSQFYGPMDFTRFPIDRPVPPAFGGYRAPIGDVPF